MKKLLSMAMVLMMVTLAGCSSQTTQPTLYNLATASVGGAFYPMGQAVATVVNDNTDVVELTAEVSNGSVENPRLVDSGEASIGITNANLAIHAINGTGPYEKQLNISAIGNLHPSVLHIVTTEGSGIETIADLKGKRLAAGPAGGGSIAMLEVMSEYYDMTIEDIESSYLSYSDGFSQLSDGNVDAAIALSGYPAGAVLEASTTSDLVFIELGDDIMAELLADNPAYSNIVVPANVYKSAADISMVGVRNMLVVNNDIPEDDVYEITKALYGNLESMYKINETSNQMIPETVLETVIPLHPGAQKYADEVKK
ncbi:MAG: TAXI family TRAP transporter solute-binding subunit [Clostridia bacterium]|nr:TAXI family TRAP transporter solute-binding subunit [Clostridia bacterium]